MAKVQIKSEKLTPFGGIFSIIEQFDSMLSPIIDKTLGHRCSSIIGYQYSEIVRSLMSVYFCGGSCVEDVTSHLMRHLSYHPMLRTRSSDTILRAIKELTQDNISYTSDQGKTYDFNTADKLNSLLANALISTGELKDEEGYDVDHDCKAIRTEYLHREPCLCKAIHDGVRVSLLSLWSESAYYLKSHCGGRGICELKTNRRAKISLVHGVSCRPRSQSREIITF